MIKCSLRNNCLVLFYICRFNLVEIFGKGSIVKIARVDGQRDNDKNGSMRVILTIQDMASAT